MQTKYPILNESLKMSMRERITKNFNVTKFDGSTGLDEKKGIWYGWSHRAVCGFKIGDKLFDKNYKNKTDTTPFTKHGEKTIKTLDQAKQAAKNFSDYVS
jgi:hypothetical protein